MRSSGHSLVVSLHPERQGICFPHVAHRTGIVNQHDGLDTAGIRIEVEDIGAIECNVRPVLERPVVQVVGDGRRWPRRSPARRAPSASSRSTRASLVDVVAHRQPAKERRLNPAIGDEQGRRLSASPASRANRYLRTACCIEFSDPLDAKVLRFNCSHVPLRPGARTA